VQLIVDAVCDPKLPLVRCEGDTVAWALVLLRGLRIRTVDLHSIENQARLQVPDLEADEPVHVRERQRLAPVDRNGADEVAEWPDFPNNLVCGSVSDRKHS
jgi:hypothetical protein